MRILNCVFILAISLFFIACGDDEVNSVSQDFRLKMNDEYGTAVKVGETLKIGIDVDSIDSNFNGNWTTVINASNPSICTITVGDKTIISSDRLEHNFKSNKTLWFNFTPDKNGTYGISVTVSNGVIEKKIEIEVIVTEYIYKVTLSCNAAEGEVLGAHEYAKGTKVSIKAVPKNGYSFVGWFREGVKVLTANPSSFTINEDHNYEARFEKSIFRVSATIQGEGTVRGQNDYPKGSNVVLEATPNKYWDFAGWYDTDGTFLSAELKYPINNVSANVTVVAKFLQKVFVNFRIHATEGVRVTTCSQQNQKLATRSMAMEVYSTVFINDKQYNVTWNSESLVVNFDFSLHMLLWYKEKGKIVDVCNGDYNKTHNHSRSLTIYQNSNKFDDSIENPRGAYGGWTDLTSLSNVKTQPSATKSGLKVYINSIVEIKMENTISYYTIKDLKTKSGENVNMMPLPASVSTDRTIVI